jgi:hypothetical protein
MTKNSSDFFQAKLSDTDNFEGFMPSGSEEFAMLIKNKGTRSFASREAGHKSKDIDGILAKLYLAL